MTMVDALMVIGVVAALVVVGLALRGGRLVLVCGLLLGAFGAHAAVDCTTPNIAVRYTPAEVSLKLETTYDKSNPFKWDSKTGCTATEYHRRNMDSQRLVYLRQVQTHLDTIPGGMKVADRIDNQTFYQLLSELAGYIYKALKNGTRSGVWSIDLNGFYGHSGYGMQRAQYFLTTSADVVCATTIPPALRQFLNLRIANGKCVIGATDVTLPPAQPFNSTTSRLGMIQTQTPPAPLSADCQTALAVTHQCHRASALFQCGQGEKPTCSTQALHQDAERICGTTVAAMNLVAMRNFYATPDRDDPETSIKEGWTPDEVCDWFLIADEHHANWHASLLSTNPYRWARVELDDEDHNRDHMALTRYSAVTKFTWSDGKGNIADQVALTAPDYLAAWRAKRAAKQVQVVM